RSAATGVHTPQGALRFQTGESQEKFETRLREEGETRSRKTTSPEEAIVHRNGVSQRKRATVMPIVAVAVSLLIATSAWAQSFRGSIRGTVTDPSGSVIGG